MNIIIVYLMFICYHFYNDGPQFSLLFSITVNLCVMIIYPIYITAMNLAKTSGIIIFKILYP